MHITPLVTTITCNCAVIFQSIILCIHLTVNLVHLQQIRKYPSKVIIFLINWITEYLAITMPAVETDKIVLK